MRRAEQMTPTEIALVGRVLDPGNGQMNSLRISQLDDEEWRTLKGLIMAGDLKVEAPYVQLATTITGLMNAGWLPDRTRNAKPQGYSVQLQADGSYAVFYGSDFRKGGFRTYGDAGLWARDRIDEEEMQSAEEWSNDPDDGHEHDFTDDIAGLPDTGTDATPVICTKCGILSAQEPEE